MRSSTVVYCFIATEMAPNSKDNDESLAVLPSLQATLLPVLKFQVPVGHPVLAK